MDEIHFATPESQSKKEYTTTQASAVCIKTNETFEGKIEYRRMGDIIDINDFSPLLRALMEDHYQSGRETTKDGKHIEFELFIPELKIRNLKIDVHMGWVALSE